MSRSAKEWEDLVRTLEAENRKLIEALDLPVGALLFARALAKAGNLRSQMLSEESLELVVRSVQTEYDAEGCRSFLVEFVSLVPFRRHDP